MRKIAILIVILLAGYVMAFSANGQTLTQYQFVGSKNSDVYHYPNCSYVDQIQEENKIFFVDAQDAVNSGYHPCSRCNPPLPAAINATPTTPTQTITPTPIQTMASPTATTQPESTLTPNPSPAVPEITSTVLVIAIIAVSAIMIALYQKKQSPSVGSEC